jgi:hypothetical protein
MRKKKRLVRHGPAHTRLVYSHVNAAYLFLFGDAPLRMHKEQLFFETRAQAIAAARRRGLRVDKRDFVHPIVRLVQPWD